MHGRKKGRKDEDELYTARKEGRKDEDELYTAWREGKMKMNSTLHGRKEG